MTETEVGLIGDLRPIPEVRREAGLDIDVLLRSSFQALVSSLDVLLI